MHPPIALPPDSLAGLTARGADIRPNLLRVLADLYVQKPVHSEDEERHFVELATRLLAVVEPQARAAFAARLASFAGAPAAIVQRLVRDLPEVAAPILTGSNLLALDELVAIAEEMGPAHAALVAARAEFSPLVGAAAQPAAPLQPDVASATLSELFFAADALERRLILLTMDCVPVPPVPPLPAHVAQPLVLALEQAALMRNTGEFTASVATHLGLSRVQAARIVWDPLGEPLVVAGKVLAMAPEILQRILLVLNPAVGQSVQRVYELTALHEEIGEEAARRMLAIWREPAADRPASRSGAHQPLVADATARERRNAPHAVRADSAPAASQARRTAAP